MKTKGIVYLVGAGPGDPGLITVRGANLLNQCDAVVYDRLVPLELVVRLPVHIQRYYVGKSAGRHSLPQIKINDLLVDLALKGLRVVRLKGGDPFIFGRGGEEALHLKNHGIPYEVIPGITAGIAASAFSGIPLTHRGQSVYAVFLTAHEAKEKDELQIPWEWLAKSHHGTIVSYMGVKQLPEVVDRLISNGLNPHTPAALIARGSTGIQREIISTLSELPKQAQTEGIAPPALFVIGPTVPLAKNLGWFGRRILSGKRIMVTRPAHQAGDLYEQLRYYGAEVLPLPTISIAEFMEKKEWEQIISFFNQNPVTSNEESERWLVFTSENGVHYFYKQLISQSIDARALAKFHFAAIGGGTEAALKEYNLKADFIPSRATTSDLARELVASIGGNQVQVIRIRGNLGDDHVEKRLSETGCRVIPLKVYETKTAVWDEGMRVCLVENPPDVITFTSGSTVSGFCEILGSDEAIRIAKRAVTLSIGPMTTKTALDLGIKITVEAKVHTIPGLMEALLVHYQHKNIRE